MRSRNALITRSLASRLDKGLRVTSKGNVSPFLRTPSYLRANCLQVAERLGRAPDALLSSGAGFILGGGGCPFDQQSWTAGVLRVAFRVDCSRTSVRLACWSVWILPCLIADHQGVRRAFHHRCESAGRSCASASSLRRRSAKIVPDEDRGKLLATERRANIEQATPKLSNVRLCALLRLLRAVRRIEQRVAR